MEFSQVRAQYPQYNDLSDQQLAEAIHQKYYSDLPFDEFSAKVGYSVAPSTADQEKVTSTSQRVMRGMRDPANGLAQMLFNSVPDSIRNNMNAADKWLFEKTNGLFGSYEPFGDALVKEEKQYQDARKAVGQEGFDGARISGNLATMVPLAMAAPGMTAKTLPGRMAVGSAYGAGFSTTNPVFNEGDYWKEKGSQATTGAIVGPIAAYGGDKLAKFISPAIDKAAKSLADKGVPLSPGQILGGAWKTTEEKMRSLPIMGDAITEANKKTLDQFNRIVYQRALSPIGKDAMSLPVGREGVSVIKRELGKAYDDLLPKLSFRADNIFKSEFANLQSMTSTLPKQQAEAFQKVIRDKVVNKMTPQGTMSGESLKTVESELGRIAKGYRSDPNFDNRQLGDAIDEVQRMIRSNLERINPQHAAQLKAINEGYANYSVIRNAASRAGSENGFSPAQLALASRAMDKTVGKGATATGTARMQDLADEAKAVISNKYPDSGTAGRALLNAGGLGLGGYVDPMIPVGLGAGAGLYTTPAQKAFQALLMSRPQYAGPLAETVRSSSPFVGVGIAPALSGSDR